MQRPRKPNRGGGQSGSQNQTPDHLRNRPWHTLPRQSTSSSNSTSNSSRPSRPLPPYTPVPSYASITPGLGVAIILKQDQSTGRLVRGVVAEVLTSGDHPRGVKVRLRDGRGGRVQGVGAEGAEDDGMGGVLGEFVNGYSHARAGGGDGGRGGGRGRGDRGRERGGGRGGITHVQDVRTEDYVWDESRPQTLGSYFSGLDALEAKDAEDREWRGAGTVRRDGDFKSELAVCPVCGVFEGDERAVAHHVEGHFGDG